MNEPNTYTPSIDSNDSIISITGMHKWFGDFHVLKNIELEVGRSERIVICGPSGSGKSTLIRCINRLEEHQRGKIVVDGTELTNDLKHIEVVRSEVGIVFQQFNLFPHLTVLENLTLALVWVRKTPKAEAEETAMRYLERVKIPEQSAKFPSQLSGGQQQRVAIARALCMNPKIMLFDEPTSALAVRQAGRILDHIAQARDQGQAVILITHNFRHALSVADDLTVLAQGRVAANFRRDEIDLDELTDLVARVG